MASSFTREHLKICIAKICLTIGWHHTTTTPLEMLADILYNYMFYLGKTTIDYAHQFGMTEANLEHLALTFKDIRINLKSFSDFMNSVQCPSKHIVPKYPLPKPNNLNFLKPGSQEVVSRQVHVHEHLPPMFPLLEIHNAKETSSGKNVAEEKSTVLDTEVDLKRRPRVVIGHSVRELTSVIMTSSGFLSPSREGKLPEACTPAIALEPSVSPTESFKTPVKAKKVFKMRREFFKQFNDHESLKRAMKVRKRKAKFRSTLPKNYMVVTNANEEHQFVTDDSLPKKESVVTETIQPIQVLMQSSSTNDEPDVEKLSAKPCKRKINILRKISSKNKPCKVDKEENKPNLEECEFKPVTPDIIHINNFPNDLTIEPINSTKSTGNNRKRKITTAEKSVVKNKRNNIVLDKVIDLKSSIFDFANFVNDNTSQATGNINMNFENTALSTNIVYKGSLSKKINTRTKSNKTSNGGEVNKQYASDFTASIIKDVGLHHNICKDLIIEPVSTMPEKSLKLESYNHTTRIDTSIAPQTEIVSRTSTSISFKDSKLKLTKSIQPLKYDYDVSNLNLPGAPLGISQPTIPPMHFPFFNPFAGPGLIPSPLLNPLFPHLPIPPLGLPSFGKLPIPVSPKSPLNLATNKETDVFKQQLLDKTPPVEVVLNDSVPFEPENNLDLKLKKKKKKRNKMKHKSEKKREKSGKKKAKELKNESLLVLPSLKIETKVDPPINAISTPSTNKREGSPELAKIAALVTGQPKQKNLQEKSTDVKHNSKKTRGRSRGCAVTQAKKEIWTCPVCGNEDNGNPMICCDDCNTWYHWVCVGIQIPPEASEDWYCRNCINHNLKHIETETGSKHRGKDKKW